MIALHKLNPILYKFNQVNLSMTFPSALKYSENLDSKKSNKIKIITEILINSKINHKFIDVNKGGVRTPQGKL
jgi:hypothetical protein